MRKGAKVILIVACVAVTSLVIAIYGLFHGYFDQGHFDIKQVQWSSSKQVAILAERYDHQAFGSLDYFVVIENHSLTPTELRHAYYSHAVVFSALADCLALSWEDQNRLVIRCNGSFVNATEISNQKQQYGDIKISYQNIAAE